MSEQSDTEAAVLASIRAFLNLNVWNEPTVNNVDSLLSHVAEDITGIGTGPGDYYPDRVALRTVIQREREQMPYSSVMEVLWINVRVLHPSLALAEGQFRSEIYVESEKFVIEPRCSFVLECKESRWLLIHFHFSFPNSMESEGGTLIDALKGRNRELEREVARRTAELEAAHARLLQQEKMASLGRLTAGIAHEIKNPLNFVNNFATLSREMIEELEEEEVPKAVLAILSDLKMNLEKIETHGRRADGIVCSMLEHSRGGSKQRQVIELNKLVAGYVNLAQHGRLTKTAYRNVDISLDLEESVRTIEVVPEEIGQVLLNLISNAFDAVNEKAARVLESFAPKITIKTRRLEGLIEIRIADNGAGIPAEIKDRIFEPFFTTKPTGSGMGLGLSLAYEIITEGHGDTLMVESTEGEGAMFIVTLPALNNTLG